jgi:hypothetical protein
MTLATVLRSDSMDMAVVDMLVDMAHRSLDMDMVDMAHRSLEQLWCQRIVTEAARLV